MIGSVGCGSGIVTVIEPVEPVERTRVVHNLDVAGPATTLRLPDVLVVAV